MSTVRTSLYLNGLFDKSCVVLVPTNPNHLSAIWHYCESPEFEPALRALDNNLNIATGTISKVSFDLGYWQKVANGLDLCPNPTRTTQHSGSSRAAEGITEPLQVAIARLLAYHWPQQKADSLDEHADVDGIACLPAVGGEQPAEERLATCSLQPTAPIGRRPNSTGCSRRWTTAARHSRAWLRDGFWTQHCRLFHNRPFIWHIWDGRKDGFAALVNYHNLDAARLDKLIYTYLGQWIDRQRADSKGGDDASAEGRLVAALDLQTRLIKIREGEKPYDIYVRWKPLHQQPIGWEPDLNDGVRLNIRPFVEARVLRGKFTISWNKDRGTNPDGSERRNDCHNMLAKAGGA